MKLLFAFQLDFRVELAGFFGRLAVFPAPPHPVHVAPAAIKTAANAGAILVIGAAALRIKIDAIAIALAFQEQLPLDHFGVSFIEIGIISEFGQYLDAGVAFTAFLASTAFDRVGTDDRFQVVQNTAPRIGD